MPVCIGSHGRSCQPAEGREIAHYRARDPRRAVPNRIVIDTLPEFKLWLRDPPDRRPGQHGAAGAARPHPAAITAMEKFVECGDMRFGAALNLHIHIHAVVSDGVFNTGADGRVCFTPVPFPTEAELAAITGAVRKKVIRRFRRIGGVCEEVAEQMLSWQNSGFSIHEKVRIEADDKQGREHLLYYCARPALSQARLVYSAKSKTVLYRADPRGARRDVLAGWGRPELITMSSMEFLRRWGLLMPPPNKNLVRYYGALAPHSPLRAKVVSKAVESTLKAKRREKLEKAVEGVKKKARSWAACLARMFEVFP